MESTISRVLNDHTIYQLLEDVINTERPREIEFHGRMLIISLAPLADKLAHLHPHPDCLIGDPDDIVHLDWSGEIQHDLS